MPYNHANFGPWALSYSWENCLCKSDLGSAIPPCVRGGRRAECYTCSHNMHMQKTKQWIYVVRRATIFGQQWAVPEKSIGWTVYSFTLRHLFDLTKLEEPQRPTGHCTPTARFRIVRCSEKSSHFRFRQTCVCTSFYLRRSHAGQWVIFGLLLSYNILEIVAIRGQKSMVTYVINVTEFNSKDRCPWPQRPPKWLLEAVKCKRMPG